MTSEINLDHFRLFTFKVYVVTPPLGIFTYLKGLQARTGIRPRSDEEGLYMEFSLLRLDKYSFMHTIAVCEEDIKKIRLTSILIRREDFVSPGKHIESSTKHASCKRPSIRGGILTQVIEVEALTFTEVSDLYWKILKKEIQPEPVISSEIRPHPSIFARIWQWIGF